MYNTFKKESSLKNCHLIKRQYIICAIGNNSQKITIAGPSLLGIRHSPEMVTPRLSTTRKMDSSLGTTA